MKTKTINNLKIAKWLSLSLLILFSCEREVSDEAVLATFSSTGEIFIDSPVGMGSDFYFPYGGSKATAWSVDETVAYEGTASMRFDVPNANDPDGNFAGAIFRIDGAGRDLTKYDALTFWIKASQGVTIGELGFGEDFILNEYVTTLTNTSVGTSWSKVIIPLPDPSKLTQERGMFRYSAGTQGTNGGGYTFWIDELKFEKLGTLAHPMPKILNGENVSEQTFIGAAASVNGLSQTFNLPNGKNQQVVVSPLYFQFTSSDSSVATVDQFGNITVSGTGTTTISASLNGVDAQGSLTLESLGNFVAAPTPTRDPSNVISVFSDAYTNIAVDHYNGYWGGSTTQGQNDININGNEVINYKALNYVGVEFHINVPTVNASSMTSFHVDIQVQEDINPGDFIRIGIQDIGADDAFGGGDDTFGSVTIPSTGLTKGSWASFDFKLADFSGLTNKSNLGQIVFVTDATIQDILVDNMYFYEIPTAPSVASPVPNHPAADVISLFSDAYTNVPVNTWRTNWSFAATTLQDVVIANDNMKEYNNLGFVGVEFVGANTVDATNMTHITIDTWSATYTQFNVKLVDAGADGDITTSADNTEHEIVISNPAQNQWVTHNIPLANFTGLAKRDKLAQLIFVGQPYGTTKVYVDNVYFKK